MNGIDAQRVEAGHDGGRINHDLVHGGGALCDTVELGDEAPVQADAELWPRVFLCPAANMAHDEAG